MYKDCAKSREVLLIVWLVAAFFLTMAYKSAFLAKLANIKYEKPIDTVEDALLSGMPFYLYGGSTYHETLLDDPRASVRKLAENQLQLFDFEITGTPKYVQDA